MPQAASDRHGVDSEIDVRRRVHSLEVEFRDLAAVRVLVFNDLECPVCARFHETL